MGCCRCNGGLVYMEKDLQGSKELSTQPKFDPEAWIKAIGRPNNTRTHIYGFGTRVLISRLLAPSMMFESACGLDVARPPLPPTLELGGYRQLVNTISKNDVVGKDNIGVDHNESNKVDVDEDIDVVYGPQDHETMNNLDVEVDEDNNVVIRNDLKSRHTLLVDVECLSEKLNMSILNVVDVSCDNVTKETNAEGGRKGLGSVFGPPQIIDNDQVGRGRDRNSNLQSMIQEEEENRDVEACRTGNSNSSVPYQGGSTVNESCLSSSPAASCVIPICRQFWRSGNYAVGDRSKLKAAKQDGRNQFRVHPMFLHSNATSHKWVFGAIAELLDNALDEVRNGATFVHVDKISNPRDESPALLIQDDGGGMDPEAIRLCMSFGFSDKKMKHAIGQYGNGLKTGSMRVGADVIVFTRHMKMSTMTQSVGLLSYTFLRQMGYDRIVIPMVDYEYNSSTKAFGPIPEHAKEHFASNLSTLLMWSPYSTEEELLNQIAGFRGDGGCAVESLVMKVILYWHCRQRSIGSLLLPCGILIKDVVYLRLEGSQFDDVGHHGTKIVIYNLWLNNDGDMELDFDSDPKDIRIHGHPKICLGGDSTKQSFDQHVANRYHYSLRAYLSILYLRLPSRFNVILRGQFVKHHNIADDLIYREFIVYKPQTGNTEAVVVTTIGFVKEAPSVNIHGYCIYHKNRLILPFWHGRKTTTGSRGRGVVGVLEANFIEPTHNKQDFEKTSLSRKLHDRLKLMTQEYWRLHCELIGYKPGRKTKVTLSSRAYLPDFVVPKRKRSALNQTRSQQGSNMKNKELNPPETDIVHHGELQPEKRIKNEVEHSEKIILMQRNKRLRSQ
ncbi:Histidine kinase-, DNA gyrase B-, and HSP90-like ATPase family protein [Theobroma cacao]|uniref:Histidine kinase-, DNA gyrase B-, and HSP90-like ATPase family protein n=1 Tax=Theobroma cacao TaxID=3641 RepID=A0A061ECT6_THECC|nr:Histidine kinase-, DNA gyrase B-, and HSP90-like ATPase family protein [Theobroma cacao]